MSALSATASGARRIRGVVSAWLAGSGSNWGPGLALLTQGLLTLALVLANVVGAAVVFVGAAWVIPNPSLPNEGAILLVNLVAAAIYVAVAVPVGVVWGNRAFRGALRAARQEREPSQEERRVVLRGPVRIGVRLGVLWMVAAAVFGVLNLRYSGILAFQVAVTVALGGVTTSAVGYLMTERLLRPATSRVLGAEAPNRPEVPGVAARALLAWALGTAVPVVGMILVAIFAVSGEVGITVGELAVTVLGLGGTALLVGLLMTVLAARAAADPVLSVRKALARVEEGELDAEVPVYDATEVGLLQAGFNRMVAGLRDRDRIREAFGTYVDRDVAEHILEEGTSLDGEEVEVTMLFLDVRDFTGFAEGRSAAETVASLNRLFERVVPIVHRHEGHIDKFVGDGLLAVFGAPRRQPDHADRALRAATEIARCVGDEAGDADVEIGIGLNTGRVLAGNVGGGGRFEFSVIGDAVNVAARVEACTRDTGDPILVTEATREALGDGAIELDERSRVELKGKSEPVALYAPAAESHRSP